MKFSPEQIARVCHEANRAYCMALGDHSIVAWDQAPVWQRSSCIAGVTAALENPAQTPEQSHAGWLALKQKEGWKYGPVKRPEVLEHPCMVPYAELPEEQRTKDALFIAIVRAMSPTQPVPDEVVVAAVKAHEEAHVEEAPTVEDRPKHKKR